MSPRNRPLLFLLFFISGFSSLVYQVVWTRLAFASFGIITPVLSVVISVFMLGLSLGTWAGGRWIGALVARSGLSAASFYGAGLPTTGLTTNTSCCVNGASCEPPRARTGHLTGNWRSAPKLIKVVVWVESLIRS